MTRDPEVSAGGEGPCGQEGERRTAAKLAARLPGHEDGLRTRPARGLSGASTPTRTFYVAGRRGRPRAVSETKELSKQSLRPRAQKQPLFPSQDGEAEVLGGQTRPQVGHPAEGPACGGLTAAGGGLGSADRVCHAGGSRTHAAGGPLSRTGRQRDRALLGGYLAESQLCTLFKAARGCRPSG